MQIAFLLGSMNTGGAENQIILLARAARDRGHEVILYNSFPDQSKEKELLKLNFEIKYYGQKGGTLKRLLWLKNDLKKAGAEVLISYHGYMSLYSGLIGKWLGIPSFGGVRSDIDRFVRVNGAIKSRFLLGLTDKIIFNSEVSLHKAVKKGIVRESKTLFLPNVLDLVQHNSPHEYRTKKHFTLLYTGAIRSEKGIWDLLNSFSILKHQAGNFNIKLRMAGTGEEIGALRDAIVDRGLSNEVVLLGDLNRQAVVDELRKADLFVFPSHSEGFPNSVLEAMALGLPVVSTAVGEVINLIDSGVNGVLVPVADKSILAEAMINLIGDHELRARIGRAAAKSVKENYSYKKLVTQVNMILQLN